MLLPGILTSQKYYLINLSGLKTLTYKIFPLLMCDRVIDTQRTAKQARIFQNPYKNGKKGIPMGTKSRAKASCQKDKSDRIGELFRDCQKELEECVEAAIASCMFFLVCGLFYVT